MHHIATWADQSVYEFYDIKGNPDTPVSGKEIDAEIAASIYQYKEKHGKLPAQYRLGDEAIPYVPGSIAMLEKVMTMIRGSGRPIASGWTLILGE